MRLISQLVLKLLGWKVVNNLKQPVDKCVCIGAPHTSNWDFILALPALAVLRVRFRYLIKKEWFFFPMSLFFKLTGGIPVDRSKRNKLTEELKRLLKENNRMYLLFPPEGTRKRVERWKTGFYHTAVDTDLPIVLGYVDYKKKEMGFGQLLKPSGDKETDFLKIEAFYKNIHPQHPEKFNPQIFIRGGA